MNPGHLADLGRAALKTAAALCAAVLLAAPGLAAEPEDSWNGSDCKSCHGLPIDATTPGGDPYPNHHRILEFLSEVFSNQWCSAGHVGNGTTMCSSYGSYFDPPTTNAELAGIHAYVVAARDLIVRGGGGVVDTASSLGSVAIGAPQATQTVTLYNYRAESVGFTPTVNVNGSDFSVVNSTCPTGPLRVPAATTPTASTTAPSSCQITVRFHPQTGASFGRSGNLHITFTGSTVTPRPRDIPLSGTALFPIYNASGFNTVPVPPSLAYSAATDSSQTFCPTIFNTGNATLNASVTVTQQPGSSADYSSYYELVPLASCPGGGASPPACIVTATPATVSGSFSVSSAGTTSCRLPLRFNPGKFGFAAGTGSRAARLTVTHNAPTAGQSVVYTLAGVATTGAQPSIGISTNPSAVGGKVLPPAFSNQVINTPSALWNEFLVSNIGDADGLDLTQVTQTNSAEFALVENCVAAAPLARLAGAGPTCTIGLTFTPNALGERCTTVTVKAAFSSSGDQATTVCGVGKPVPIPRLVVTPTAVDFGPRSIGGMYQPAQIVVKNDATATAGLQLGAITLGGSGFVFVPDASACLNKLLAVGASCTLQVQFNPDPTKPDLAYTGSLVVNSNDPATPVLSVPLAAVARASAVPVLVWQVPSTTLAFPGLVIAGQQSATTLTARLANVDGPGAVDIQAVRTVGADASSFVASGCPALLFQGQFCDISVTFQPGSGGAKAAQLQVVSANGSVPAPLVLQGQGVGGSSSRLIVSTDSLAFGRVRLGARSEPLAVTLAAGGDGVLRVTGIEADAPFTIVSQTCPAAPFTLPLGSDCSVTVTFTPTATSDASAKLRIKTDASAQATEVGLDGVGQPAADVSGGGCSIASGDTLEDPTLWALVLLASAVLAWRRRGAGRRSLEPRRSDERAGE